MPTKSTTDLRIASLRIASYPAFLGGFFFGSVKSPFAKAAFRCPSGVAVRPPSAVPPPQARPVVDRGDL